MILSDPYLDYTFHTSSMYYTTNEALKAASIAIWVGLGWESERSRTQKINFVLPWPESYHYVLGCCSVRYGVNARCIRDTNLF